MDLTQIYAIATIIAVITTALAQVVKVTFDVKARYMPLVSLGIGMLLGVASQPISAIALPVLLWAGGISGLMASGLFDTAKTMLNNRKDDNNDNAD